MGCATSSAGSGRKDEKPMCPDHQPTRGGRAAPAERHELRKAPSNEMVADRAKEIDLQASDHAAPGDRRRAHEVRLTAARRSPVENFRCLAAEGYQPLRM